MPARIPDDKRAAIAAAIRTGRYGNREIARLHSVSPATVTNIARSLGGDDAFERSQTKSATAAAEADNRARRATEASSALADAPAVRMNILASTSGRDAQGWAVAYGILVDKHVSLERHDATDPGAMGSLLGTLLTSLQQKHGTGDA